MMKFTYDGFCRPAKSPGKMYAYKGTCEPTPAGMAWQATVMLEGTQKGVVKGVVTGLAEINPIRLKVEIDTKQAIEDMDETVE